MDIVKLAIHNSRLTISALLFLILAGALAYESVPKEAEPDVPIPMMYISLSYQGISPEDSERLLLRPMETKLKSLKGLKEMRSAAFQGGGYVLVEFQPQTDLATALQDTRSKVQDAKADLPQAADEPTVTEVNVSEFPVLVVTLSGNVPERVLTAAARELRDRIEEVPGVLEGSLQGARDDLVEVVIDPVKLSSYGLQLDQLIQGVAASNNLVAAGNLEGSQGKYAVKVPSLIETPEDVANLPVVVGPNAVVQAKNIATVRSTFKDAETVTRLDGKPAIAIEVKKRIGANPNEKIYWRRNKIERDVAVAFLIDMSASTDEEINKREKRYDEDDYDDDPRKYLSWWVSKRRQELTAPPKRIIDLEKESTVLLMTALETIGDQYGIYGFSGYGRDNVEFFVIKDFDETLNQKIKNRLDKITPIRSTRMGPAIRHATHKLNLTDAKVKILVLLSDGRPQDHGYGRDRTEKEYAIHDTKQALNEAKHEGITPFALTVDRSGHDYLKTMCEDMGYEVVADIEALPSRLPSLYRRLTE